MPGAPAGKVPNAASKRRGRFVRFPETDGWPLMADTGPHGCRRKWRKLACGLTLATNSRASSELRTQLSSIARHDFSS